MLLSKFGWRFMLEVTVKQALEGEADTKDHYLYLCRDGTTVFYVGRSTAPLERLYEHLGRGDFTNRPSPLGKLILNHMPHSLAWIMQFMTIADCESLVQQYRPEYYEWYIQQTNRYLAREAAEVAEEALIDHYQPYLNIAGNRAGLALPEKYRKPPQWGQGEEKQRWQQGG